MGPYLSRLERAPDKRKVGGSSPLGPTTKLSADECIREIECSHEYLTKYSMDFEKRIGEKQIKIRQMYDLSLDRKKFFKI